MRTFYDYYTPVGKLYIEAEEDFLTKLSFFELSGKRLETPVIKETYGQLNSVCVFFNKRGGSDNREGCQRKKQCENVGKNKGARRRIRKILH